MSETVFTKTRGNTFARCCVQCRELCELDGMKHRSPTNTDER